ncbi:MAG: alkaline phosphatase family protein [Chryseobacterium sp.]|nr:MAG: alkaline phosphatase family protein [Chryseobacterium sp.]
MRKSILIALFASIALSVNAQKKKAVFIIIDGVGKDVIEKLATPNIHAIAKEGTLISAYQGGERGEYNQTPTISAPGYNNVLTGVWFNKHNVPDNSIKAPNYYYPTVFRFFKTQYPEKKIGIFSSWEDNRTKLVGDALQETGNIKVDYKFDGLELDTIQYPHDKARRFMAKIDQAVTDEAARCIREQAPDLSWVYLEFTDDMGHAFGDSQQYNDAVIAADKRIGQIWAAVKQREKQFNEDWIIVVTTDHGRDPKTGRGHGGQSDRERSSWIATDAKTLNVYAQKGKASVVDILPTLATHLGILLSDDQKRELEGVTLLGKVSLYNVDAKRTGDKVNLAWVSGEDGGKVKISLAHTNNYKQTGKGDNYILLAEVPAKKGSFDIDLSQYPQSEIYKVIIEGTHNTVNRWIINKK